MCSCFFFFFKQKTAYEMRISDWSSDVCSSDLRVVGRRADDVAAAGEDDRLGRGADGVDLVTAIDGEESGAGRGEDGDAGIDRQRDVGGIAGFFGRTLIGADIDAAGQRIDDRSEEHTSELQSLMRISYAVFCLKKKI